MLAPSKLNLILAVTGKRNDGYHELDTVFFPLTEPSDDVSIDFSTSSNEDAAISCDDPAVPQDPEKNLCGKAAKAYFLTAGIKPPEGMLIRIEKRIPIAAGMGGGSSDAAAVLLLLQRRFHALSQEELMETALSLGADVPFFLDPRPARARGVGEKLTALENAPASLPILIAAPGFPVSAAWAYRRMDLSKAVADPPCTERLIQALAKKDLPALAACMRNDLEDALLTKFPLLSRMRNELNQLGALKTMVSGSGPTLFSLFPSCEDCCRAHAAASRRFDSSIRLFKTCRLPFSNVPRTT